MDGSSTHLISNCGYLDQNLIFGDIMIDHIAALFASIVGEKDALAGLQVNAHNGSEAGSDEIRFAELLDHGVTS